MKKVSFVIPCYRSAKTLPAVVQEIRATMDKLQERYTHEIILINDCSPDNTYEVICQLANVGNDIIGADMAKNFGQHAALMAGYHYATGDIIVSLDDDGQTPANEVEKLLSFDEIAAVTVLGKNKMNIYVDEHIYQFKGSKRFNALKYVNLYHRYKNMKTGDGSGRFLGL